MTSVPVMPMATPMSAVRSGGGVVHAVTGHGGDVAVGLERPHHPDLVLGRHPGAHPDVVDPRSASSSSAMASSSSPLDDLATDTERRRRSSAGGGGVVTGDHLHVDAGPVAAGDGVAGLVARRVHDADQRLEGQFVHQPVG